MCSSPCNITVADPKLFPIRELLLFSRVCCSRGSTFSDEWSGRDCCLCWLIDWVPDDGCYVPIFTVPIVMLIVHLGPTVDSSICHGQCDALMFTWTLFYWAAFYSSVVGQVTAIIITVQKCPCRNNVKVENFFVAASQLELPNHVGVKSSIRLLTFFS